MKREREIENHRSQAKQMARIKIYIPYVKWVKTSWEIKMCAPAQLIMKAWKFETCFGNCQWIWWIMWDLYIYESGQTKFTKQPKKENEKMIERMKKKAKRQKKEKNIIYVTDTKETACVL